ncbi:helix-turn-helix domain-containing protein [Desulfosporosinus sp. SYSU MS00001]|uniref:helix-turn-helix domain-containing protein n=1 Tax=Desulfosporosinus sp. SYSU MS00001 TaxID=3416284 RepID=UPI003CF9E61E
MQSKPKFLTKAELARVLNVTYGTIIRWIAEGKVPLIKIGNKVLISQESIPLIKRNIGHINTDEYMGLTEFLGLFKISHETYLNWIKRGWVKTSVQFGKKVYIPLSSINEIKKLSGYVNEEDYISVKQLSSMLNLSPEKILRLIKSGLLVSYHLYKDKYLFKSDSIEDIKQSIGYIDDYNPNEYLRINQVKEKLNLDFNFQYWKTKIPYILHMGTPYINIKDLPLIYDVIKHDKGKPAFTEYLGLENYVDTSKAAELLKISKGTLSQKINSGIIKGAIKVPFNTKQTKWMIPMESIVDYKPQSRISLIKHKKAILMPSNTINLKTIADKTGLSLQTLRIKVKNKQLFTNAQKVKGLYCIPIEEADEFIASRPKQQYHKKGIIYTNKDALEELLRFISAFPLPFNLRKTQDLFVEFCKIKLGKLRGNPSHVQSFFGYYQSVFEILGTFSKNLYELDVSFIDSIIYNKMTSDHKRRIFIHFHEYCYTVQGLSIPKKYVVFKSKKTKREKEIYSPEAFYSFYRYVKDLMLHLPNAINNQYYANMWAYTIMHLTDAWRATDIVFNMPKIDISSIQVDSFDWFKANVLSITQCQKVINQLYLHFRSIRTSKTTTFVTFLVEPELVEPLSTALIISELHRQKEAQSFLLESFIYGERKTVATSGKNRHQEFFKFNSSLEPFKSLKFNNSTLTYFFYSIGDEDGNDSDVALELTQRIRSHNRAETTAIYVQATNRDGSLNQVSSNLFRRGHFGWLYNYLILLASEKVDVTRTMEEKTEAIVTLRNQLGSPNQAEKWAQFLLKIKQKRNSVMTRLAKLSKESLIEIIIKIFKGEMPSKTENAQCITHPICEYPRLNSCYSCPNIIPKNYLFIELSGEFDRLINSIETTQYSTIRKKDSYFLLNLLLLLDEGIKFFGGEYIEAFIEMQNVRNKLSELADKIYIE